MSARCGRPAVAAVGPAAPRCGPTLGKHPAPAFRHDRNATRANPAIRPNPLFRRHPTDGWTFNIRLAWLRCRAAALCRHAAPIDSQSCAVDAALPSNEGIIRGPRAEGGPAVVKPELCRAHRESQAGSFTGDIKRADEFGTVLLLWVGARGAALGPQHPARPAARPAARA